MKSIEEQSKSDPLIPSCNVRLELGGISYTTLWRWERDDVLPPPVRIRGRKYWRRSTIRNLALNGAAA